ncbi:sensor histidine kinase [Lysinibacillus sp. NPDC094177]|uniref:sensor histidine kinase n=1 Tax=Lysinibacillus sp. NPDC094177 TaxID=3390580 RepID=UPI003CFE7B75
MEFFIILSKLILLGYLSLWFIHDTFPVQNIPWIIFSLLTYLIINIVLYIVKRQRIKKVVLVLSLVQIIFSFYKVHPFFIFLLPLNVCEFSPFNLEKRFIMLILVFLPLIWLQDDLRFQYGLVAALNCLIYLMLIQFITRLQRQEEQLDMMRKNLQKITKSLNDNNEFIRQSEYTFKLEERNRLAQVFHDKIGHAMTGALIQMEAAKRLVESDQVKALELLQNAINISKLGIENIRMTLKNLKPPTEQMGINRVKLFIEEFSAKHSMDMPFVYKGNMGRIAPIQWNIIQENLTEALTNALKYSEATTVSIEIHVLNTMIKVEVKDNGVGIQKVKKGLGLIGMEERTASINGKIIVDGSHGFSVTMLIPIQ